MSNLGTYQWITTAAKKMGGPTKFLAGVALCGYAVLRFGEKVVVTVIKKARVTRNDVENDGANKSKVYSVKSQGKSNEGIEFAAGDKYRVLESDGDAILIERLNDPNSPYFVAADFLRSISDYC